MKNLLLWFQMKLTECEKHAEDFVRGKRGVENIKITGIRNKDVNTVEVKGYCEDTRFTVELDKNLADIVAYDFMDDNGGFDLFSGIRGSLEE